MKEPFVLVTLRVSYPDKGSDLAAYAHMYICIENNGIDCCFAKRQSYKPYHSLPGSKPDKRIVEAPDKSRNPFIHPTLIDLDKLFVIDCRVLNDSVKSRIGVNDALLSDITALIAFTPKIRLSVEGLKLLNPRL
ncbi:MAG: hypothetical protein LBS84_02460 [Clostridiales bacterium]|jgi:hypothetical protein|nr:hypothetical protein [Clostridiales bacterium]